MAENLWVGDGYVEEGWIQTGIEIDWDTGVIFVPKAVLTLVQTTPVEVYNLSLDFFWREIRALEDTAEGRAWSRTCDYNQPVTVSGIQLAAVLLILEPYTVTFEDGQYAVNLIGANTNLQDRVNVNQVSIRAGNSAGLVQTSEIQYSSYQNGVTIDQNNVSGKALTGQAYPAGTPEQPCLTLEDALFIANFRSLDKIYIKGNFTFGAADVVSGIIFEGDSATRHVVIMPDAATISNCIFRNLTILGSLDGGCSASNCIIAGLDYIDGSLLDCLFSVGDIVLFGAQANFLRCGDAIADSTGTNIDLNGGGTNLVVADHKGDLEFSNCNTAGADVQIGLDKGKATFNADITEGVYRVYGVGTVVDNTTGNAVVDVTELLDPKVINPQIQELYELQGLDAGNPMTVTPTSRTTTNVDLTISGDGETTTTVTRN